MLVAVNVHQTRQPFSASSIPESGNRTRVRTAAQTEGSAAASFSAAGSVSRRIVRVQR